MAGFESTSQLDPNKFDPSKITRQMMRKYHRQTQASNMRSAMDLWKTWMAATGRADQAETSNYYAWKRAQKAGKAQSQVAQTPRWQPQPTLKQRKVRTNNLARRSNGAVTPNLVATGKGHFSSKLAPENDAPPLLSQADLDRMLAMTDPYYKGEHEDAEWTDIIRNNMTENPNLEPEPVPEEEQATASVVEIPAGDGSQSRRVTLEDAMRMLARGRGDGEENVSNLTPSTYVLGRR